MKYYKSLMRAYSGTRREYYYMLRTLVCVRVMPISENTTCIYCDWKRNLTLNIIYYSEENVWLVFGKTVFFFLNELKNKLELRLINYGVFSSQITKLEFETYLVSF